MTDTEEEELRRALERLANNAYGVPPLAIHRRSIRAALKGLEGREDGLDGNEVVFYQWSNKGGDHFSRSCAMRVHNIGEVCRMLEVFFEVGHAVPSVAPLAEPVPKTRPGDADSEQDMKADYHPDTDVGRATQQMARAVRLALLRDLAPATSKEQIPETSESDPRLDTPSRTREFPSRATLPE